MDGDGTGRTYGANPPAQAITLLKGPLMPADGIDNPLGVGYGINGTGFGDGIVDNERLGMSYFTYHNNASGPCGDPYLATEYYNYMTGHWIDGYNITFGGNGRYSSSTPTRFMFTGTSDTTFWGTGGVIPQGATGDWSEISVGNTPADRRGVGSFGPFTLGPLQQALKSANSNSNVQTFTMAYITAQGAVGNLSSVDSLNRYIDFVRGYNIPEVNKISNSKTSSEFNLIVYPNPYKDNINIRYNIDKLSTVNIEVLDMYGRKIETIVNTKQQNGEYSYTFNKATSSGLYLIKIVINDKVYMRKIIRK